MFHTCTFKIPNELLSNSNLFSLIENIHILEDAENLTFPYFTYRGPVHEGHNLSFLNDRDYFLSNQSKLNLLTFLKTPTNNSRVSPIFRGSFFEGSQPSPHLFQDENNFNVFLQNYEKLSKTTINLEVHNKLINEFNFVCFSNQETFTINNVDFEIVNLTYQYLPVSGQIHNQDQTISQNVRSVFSPTSFFYLKEMAWNKDLILDQEPNEYFSNDYFFSNCINYSHRGSVIKNYPLNTFQKDCPLTFCFSENIIDQIIETSNKSRYDVIQLPAIFTSKTKDREIKKTSFTAQQLKKRKTSFIPNYSKYNCLGEDLAPSTVYILNMISNLDSTLIHSGRLLLSYRLSLFFKELFLDDSLSIFDLDKLIEKRKEKYGSLLKYSNTFHSNLPSAFLDALVASQVLHVDSFDNQSNSILSSTLKVDSKLENKYQKINQRFNDSLTSLKDNKSKESSKSLSSKLFRLKQYKKALEECISEIEQEKKSLVSSFNSLVNSFKFISSNKSIYNSISEKYNEAILSALDNNQIDNDNFFINLSKSNIKILSIDYSIASLAASQHLDFNSSPKDFLNFVRIFNFNQNKDSNILKVTFLIDKLVKINVPSKGTAVYGGPYIVEVAQNSLKIKLAYSHSLFGLSSHSCYVHPHASSYSLGNDDYISENFFSFRNACLGEASPLIFNAFENNNLKTIIMSALTWVTSANEADVWGKNYIHFPTLSDINEASLDEDSIADKQNSISKEEISSMLESIEFEGHPVIEQTPEQQTPQEEIVQEETPQEETVSPVQQHTYSPYFASQMVNNETDI